MNLAVIPSPSVAVWHVGAVPIRAYALCIVAGIVAAAAITEVRMRRRGAPPWAILDVTIWAVVFGILGARLYHVVSSPADYFGANGHPLQAFEIWNGGLGIWGGVAGGAVGAWIACRQIGLPLTLVADSLAPGLPVAQAIGRLGNWFNNELFGGPTNLPWGLRVYEFVPGGGRAKVNPDGSLKTLPGFYHPTFLYELLWNLGVALVVWLADRKYKFGAGRAFALYAMAYTVGRAWIEAMRSDPAVHFIGVRLNVWTSIVVFIGALVYFIRRQGPRAYVVPEGKGYRVVTEEEFANYRPEDAAEADKAGSATGDGRAADDGPADPDDADPDAAGDRDRSVDADASLDGDDVDGGDVDGGDLEDDGDPDKDSRGKKDGDKVEPAAVEASSNDHR